MSGKLFISYSRKDARWLERLDVFLKPFEARGRMLVWTDRELLVGEDWELAISRALAEAAVALLLVTPDFLASEYIRQRELPMLLAARERGQLALACLYVRASNVSDVTFEFTSADGAVKSVPLTAFQGLNMPDDAVASRRGNRRDEQLTQAARRLEAIMAERDTAPPAPDHPAGERLLLDALLTRQGDTLTRLFEFGAGRRLETRSSWRAEPADLSSDAIGMTLFRVLFGDSPKTYQEILRNLGGAADGAPPQPIRYPLRVRVRTRDASLAALPWGRTTWEGEPLTRYGWSFELVRADVNPQSLKDHTFRAPCPIMAIIDRTAAGGAGDHVRAVQEHLDKAWPVFTGSLTCVDDLQSAVAAWQRQPAHVLYLLDRVAGDDAGLPGLGGSVLDLSEVWGDQPPEVVFLNLLGHRSAPVAAALLELSRGLPLLVAQFGDPADPFAARQAALGWLGHLLGQAGRVEPVLRLQQQALPEVIAIASYREWMTETSAEPPREKLARLLLDRTAQRGEVHRALSELVHKADRRMYCFLATGRDGNLVELFADQLLDWFRRYAPELAVIRRLRLRLPDGSASFDTEAIATQLRRDLRIGKDACLCTALSTHQPRVAARSRPVLLLDWGVRGGAHGPAPDATAIEAWTRLNASEIAAALNCRDAADLRLLSCLTLELDTAERPWIEATMRHLRETVRDRAFRLSLLPELDRVEETDLLEFLDDESNSSVPAELLDQMPPLLIAHSGGDFARTVELIEQAERGGWFELHDRLSATKPERRKP
jgi:hypothetical protein